MSKELHRLSWEEWVVYKCMQLTLLGSIVQKGKFSAGMETLPSVLNSVLLPTLGSPTMPICIATDHDHGDRGARCHQMASHVHDGRASRVNISHARARDKDPRSEDVSG